MRDSLIDFHGYLPAHLHRIEARVRCVRIFLLSRYVLLSDLSGGRSGKHPDSEHADGTAADMRG